MGGAPPGTVQVQGGRQGQDIGKTEAVISQIKTKRNQILEMMESIIIPEIDFRQADIREAIDFLTKASLQYDKQKRGVNFVVDFSPGPQAFRVDPSLVQSGQTDVKADIPKITFAARRIGLLEALRSVTATDMKYRIENNIVAIVPVNAPEGKIIVRAYRMQPMEEEIPLRMGIEWPDWQQFFSEMGVKWPVGSSIKYVPAMERLIVANTVENHTVIERILEISNESICQIEVTVQFVEFEQASITATTVTRESLLNLWTNGHGKVIAAPMVVIPSGTEVTAKGVTEYMLSEWVAHAPDVGY